MNGTDSSTGALAGRFDLQGEIGSGSSGTVHRARTREAYGELPPGTEVAVKFLRQDRLSDPSARYRLLAEGRLGQKLRSPYVARIHGVETLELMGLETTYLVMELVEGPDLRDLLDRSGPVVEDLARRIGMDAALGLEALHRLGVVHRDLKPENLAITPGGQVKLMDLGLATAHSPAPSRGSFAGSVTYAAPEVLRGGPATPRSDLYSLGIVLFELATGRHPFAHHEAIDDLLLAHLEEPPPRASHVRPRVSTFVEALLDDLMAKDPKMRPSSARELAHTFQLGEQSPYWREREQRVPVLASRRRLNRVRRPAPTAFVGRTAELQLLEQAISAATAGRGSALCIQGAEGVGRRRLLDEALSRMLDAPDAPRFLGGEAVPGLSEGHGLPLSRMLLEWCLRGDHPDSPKASDRAAIRLQREAHMAAEEAAKLAAILTGERGDDPPEVRADLLARGFLQLSTVHPLVLRVDRAEQLGTTGRLVLERLVEEAPGHRLVVLTVTDGTEDIGSTRGETVPLGPMSPQEFAALGRFLFRSGAVEQEFLDTAYRTLAGNPENLMDALNHLADRGKLEGQPGYFHGLRVAVAPPAPPLLSRLSARVRDLPANEQRVLNGAAVLGERFRITDLASLTGESELRVLESLSVLPGGVIRAVQGGGRFLHQDYRRALLRGVPSRERRSLHRAAAGVAGSRGAGPLEVGLHLSWAGEHQECLEPLLEALEQLVRRQSRRSSARLVARIRVHLKAAPDSRENRERRLRFFLLAARVVPAAEREEREMHFYRQASEVARELQDHVSLGEALTGMATVSLESGRFLVAQSLLERAHVALERSGGRVLAARAFGLHARVMAYLCQPDPGLQHLRNALRILPPRDVGQLTHLLVDRARLERLGYDFGAALVTLDRAERLLRDHPSPIAELRIRLYRGQIFAELNDRRAVSQLREAAQQAHRLSNPRMGAKALLLLGNHELGRGNRAIAADLLREAAQLGHRARDRLTESHALVLLQEPGTSTPDLEETVDDLGSPSLKVAWLLGESRRHIAAGRPEMVRVCADEAMDIVAAVTLPLLLHLRALQLGGEDARARDLAGEIASRLPAGTSRRRFRAAVDRLTVEIRTWSGHRIGRR